MSLASFTPIGFIPTARPDAARHFYEQTLGLTLETDDEFAMVFRSGGVMLRVVRMDTVTPAPFTIFGWEVPDVSTLVPQLTAAGIQFLHFALPGQDAHGIWTAPGGAKVAWFKDPDGNILSISQHTR